MPKRSFLFPDLEKASLRELAQAFMGNIAVEVIVALIIAPYLYDIIRERFVPK